jgi:hypothetical protein
MSPSLLGRRDADRAEYEDVDFDFIAVYYMETICPSSPRKPCDDLFTFTFLPPRGDHGLFDLLLSSSTQSGKHLDKRAAR